ncbi:MAG TPA: molybdenum cofactor biosynthesis protein B [Candidatus Binataceae bacterium]|nr:molybdenum cofactor biosynthesis protein B [Candidatus Binataceae bacterium]
MSVQEHKSHARAHLRIGVLTASDTRTPETDKSGQLIRQLAEAAGHRIEFYKIVPDDAEVLAATISAILGPLEALIITGGTGVAPRDCTADVVKKMLATELPGFGELFRMLSYQEIGSAALASRAVAGMLNGKFLAALPGSTGGCRLAMEKLILPELGHLVDLANPK